MCNLFLIAISFIIISSCSIESSPKNPKSLTEALIYKLAPNEYKVRVTGNIFSTPENIKDRTLKEANKLCGNDNYNIKSNDKQRIDTFMMTGPNGTIPITMNGDMFDTIIACK